MDEIETHFFVLMKVWIILAQMYTMNAQLLLYRQRQRKRKRNDRDVDLAAIMDASWDGAITEMKRLNESFTLGEAKVRLPSKLQAIGLPIQSSGTSCNEVSERY